MKDKSLRVEIESKNSDSLPSISFAVPLRRQQRQTGLRCRDVDLLNVSKPHIPSHLWLQAALIASRNRSPNRRSWRQFQITASLPVLVSSRQSVCQKTPVKILRPVELGETLRAWRHLGEGVFPILSLISLSETLGLNRKAHSRLDLTITVVISIMDLAGGGIVTTCALEVSKRMEKLLETTVESLSSSKFHKALLD